MGAVDDFWALAGGEEGEAANEPCKGAVKMNNINGLGGYGVA